MPHPPVNYQKLLRPLMIMCPATARATDTGFELDAVPSIPWRRQLLVDCLECGQDHEWRLEADLQRTKEFQSRRVLRIRNKIHRQ